MGGHCRRATGVSLSLRIHASFSNKDITLENLNWKDHEDGLAQTSRFREVIGSGVQFNDAYCT
jgi:hypothetical protein